MHVCDCSVVLLQYFDAFQVERPSCEPSTVPGHHVTHDKASLLPEVEVVDGIATLTDRGRYQVLATIVNTILYYQHRLFVEGIFLLILDIVPFQLMKSG